MKVIQFYSVLFFLTGIFAAVGGVFTWGRGWVFDETMVKYFLIPMTDLFMVAPFSLLAAFFLNRRIILGIVFGLLTSGMYLFGSIQVYLLILKNDFPASFELLIPPVFGMGIAVAFSVWSVNQLSNNH